MLPSRGGLGRTILSKIAALQDTATIAGNHADIFDALTAGRPYRKAMTITDALELMARDVDTAIDPECFAALRRGLAKMQRVAAA